MEPMMERRRQSGPPWVLPALVGLAAAVLLAGLVVLVVTRGDDTATPTTTTTTTLPVTTTVAPSTTLPETTTAPTTVASTVASTTTPTTEPSPTTTVPAGPDGQQTWVIESALYPDEPFAMRFVTAAGPLSAYDGRIRQGDDAVRCVAITVTDEDGWHEACTFGSSPAMQYVVVAGVDPWLVTVGQNVGELTLAQQTPAWSLPTNGCGAATVALIDAAAVSAPMTSSLTCADEYAIVGSAPVVLQLGGADSGLSLLSEGAEGWNSDASGTSMPCAQHGDACQAFGEPDDLVGASLPMPPAWLLPASLDIVNLHDDTGAVRDWVGDETDPDAIVAIVTGELTDPDAEAEPTVRREGDLGGASQQLMIVDVPTFDDSVTSTTWAIWINPPGSDRPAIERATLWDTCARGVSGNVCT